MVQSAAKTVEGYLQELPEERRLVVKERPLSRYPDTHNGQHLAYVGLAAQKNSYSLYLIGCYMDPKQTKTLADAFRKEGKKLDMGKSCVRFKSADDLPLDAIGKLIASCSVDDFIAAYEKGRQR